MFAKILFQARSGENASTTRLSFSKPVQIFISPPVVLLSFISRFAFIRLQIDCNTTGYRRKKIGRENSLLQPHFQNHCCNFTSKIAAATTFQAGELLKMLLQPSFFKVAILDQIFFWDPVVLESICYRRREKRLINKSKKEKFGRVSMTLIS